MTFHQHKLFFKKNVFLILFILIVGFVCIVSILKFLTPKEVPVYVTVKVSQGYWWANTSRPAVWLAKSFKKGDIERSPSGKQRAEIVAITYYPSTYQDITKSQYDIYLTLKLSANYNKVLDTFIFKREPVAVGAPIDLTFPNTQVSATIIEVSKEPIKSEYEEIIITLNKPFSTGDEFEQITVGDVYYDGNQNAAEVLSKESFPSPGGYIADNQYIATGSNLLNVYVRIRLKVKKINNVYIYQEDIVMLPGKEIELQTNRYFFTKYKILRIE